MTVDSIGLDVEHRSDFDLRKIFVAAYELVVPFLDAEGRWLSLADECLAQEALVRQFPELTGSRQFAVLGSIAAVRATGRIPVD